LVIRDRRRALGLSQSELARRTGVGRQWLVGVEQGKATAEIGMVLRTLSALDLTLAVEGGGPPPSSELPTGGDIDAAVRLAGPARP
jgi:HTH-type transcriptional regulator/antitoxin HipB